MSLSPDEVRFLRTCEIPSDRELSARSAIEDAEFFRRTFGEFGRAAFELAKARSAHKLPDSWLMCHESMQQATPPAVAQVRARRIARLFPDALVHDVTCSIGTEAHACVEEKLNYYGSDLDRSRILMAQHNVPAPFHIADALQPAMRADIVIADPARRVKGRRIFKPEDLLPPLPDLISAHPQALLAIKCAPGIDFSEWDGLVSVVSTTTGVKEACLYSGALSEGHRREAVMITNSGIDTVTDALPDDVGAGEPGKYILDPDGAVVRAGLVRHYAHREGLWMLDERIAYLTGDEIPLGRSGFEYIETVPMKKLKAALKAHDAGTIEILVRGVDCDPDALRKKLALKGKTPMTVVLTRIGTQGVALVCRAREFRHAAVSEVAG
ncbi:MAG: SAM-dependent methyltransferase [Corynebacterium sp.]|uniref:THUMP-like domain-containing protein n=1 Tax=Corynebacterium sp. TaxID=1720 RepID=UPI0026DB94DD|nr:SAM-dependent methyltransferase [Corynebacterium sp.]MDO4760539.1 SAM-dependent methyltransferase [Corynebacterium sp.]